MPGAPMRPCTQPGCTTLTADGRCEAHRRKAWAHEGRESRHARGYGSAWTRLREQILKRDGYLCLTCQRAGRLGVATEVDHVVCKAEWKRRHGTLEGVDHPSNLESICTDDHKAKTAREMGRAPARRIGADGYVVDEP